MDLGGTIEYWESLNFKYIDTAKITFLNLSKEDIPDTHSHFTSAVGDATDLHEYGDEAMDLMKSVRLMTEKELKELFPGATICREKILFLTKIFIYFSSKL